MTDVRKACEQAKGHSWWICGRTTAEKNAILGYFAEELVKRADEIIAANRLDLQTCKEKPASFLDRLLLM